MLERTGSLGEELVPVAVDAIKGSGKRKGQKASRAIIGFKKGHPDANCWYKGFGEKGGKQGNSQNPHSFCFGKGLSNNSQIHDIMYI
jgi:hypothetical protein